MLIRIDKKLPAVEILLTENILSWMTNAALTRYPSLENFDFKPNAQKVVTETQRCYGI